MPPFDWEEDDCEWEEVEVSTTDLAYGEFAAIIWRSFTVEEVVRMRNLYGPFFEDLDY